jgi:hypothetical protein
LLAFERGDFFVGQLTYSAMSAAFTGFPLGLLFA